MRPHRAVIGALVPGLLVMVLAASVAPRPSGAAAARPASHGSTVAPVLPWIEDQYSRAVAEARARKLPLFVESWAPW